MPLFRRKAKLPAAVASAFRSVEHLPPRVEHQHQHQHQHQQHPDDRPRRLSSSSSASASSSTARDPSLPQPQPHHSHAYAHPHFQSHPHSSSPLTNSSSPKPPPYSTTAAPLRRSKSHRSPRENTHPSWPLPNQSNEQELQEPRKSRRSLFSLHSSATTSDTVQRNRSVKKFSAAGRRNKHQRPLSIDTSSDCRPATAWTPEHDLDGAYSPPSSQEHIHPHAQSQPQLQPWPQPQSQSGQLPSQPRLEQPPQPLSQDLSSRPPSQEHLPPQLRSGVHVTRWDSQPPQRQPQPQPQAQTQPRPHPSLRAGPPPASFHMPQNTVPTLETRPPRSPHSTIQRSNTDSGLLDHLARSSPIDPPRKHHGELAPTQPQLDPTVGARPPSRQSVGPPSPLRQQLPPTQPESPSGMTDRPSGVLQASSNSNQAASGASHTLHASNNQSDTGYRTNAAQPSADAGRSTPSVRETRDARREARDESSDIDVRALVQKHDELQAKYSKVKRYYFEKEAQVQHLQNTVAHQRMAVSRTVLDDNEYASRFSRLDGAIKDLAFSIRKDWARLPPWLTGYVSDDAHTTGTKEMTAIGRAVMSRWLVEEVFERYFHPGLEPALSRALKDIEMNLRRQQVQVTATTDEDRENAVARISNWRRTTLDGLPELQASGTQAADFRAQLIDRLVGSLVATLTAYMRIETAPGGATSTVPPPPPPGLETGARMIVENAIGIAEKIPLESRDIVVEYILPGAVLNEGTMRVESGIPPLPQQQQRSTGTSLEIDRAAAAAVAAAAAASEGATTIPDDIDMDREFSAGVLGVAGIAPANTNTSAAALAPPTSPTNPSPPRGGSGGGGGGGSGSGAGGERESRKRSMFSSLMGRRTGPAAATAGAGSAGAGAGTAAPGVALPTGPGSVSNVTIPGTTASASAPSAGSAATEDRERLARIRFSSFVLAEVRGRGPQNVLVKAPVYIE
ncbi:hypothetical protein ASPACDRAFT_45394 [Aspergillus aculeatus ATCC 16872]|uniref:Uncharacterized protein n=1 Tax=Aspergillus aculeatus (strain ATCC 16872 / CBS 172.66 / WB 5094) TaxID=690307 RepID=A0A1L9WPI5_ASPA1|nr:uncharacterized protein ASPACDRAFT_45394 [Aspergillus aculeatus ATCC 16872]OJJ98095.1 hypothetical protein ASPACDRAFT_45394 [Aspergillus aculeatus ATCC 16872]